MFNFNSITHILKYPTGKYGSVGSVPASMLTWHEPTAADAMTGRVHNGKAHKTMVFDTAEAWLDHARKHEVNVCQLPGCACRKYF